MALKFLFPEWKIVSFVYMKNEKLFQIVYMKVRAIHKDYVHGGVRVNHRANSYTFYSPFEWY